MSFPEPTWWNGTPAFDTQPKDEMSGRKIITRYIYPPIPVRQFDWCAFYEDLEEDGNYGWGETREAAIEDLKANYEEPL